MKFIIYILLVYFLNGCATTGAYSDTGIGFLFNAQKEAGSLGVDRGSRETGQSCCHNILGWFTIGDCSIKASKKKGGLRSVSFYDKDIFRILSLYGKVCTNVYGK